MNKVIDVIPENSNDIPGYRQTTAGWQQKNQYKLNADWFQVTHKVGYKGDFDDGNIVQSFTQWQDFDAVDRNKDTASKEQATFMNIVCNVWPGNEAKNSVALTCGELILQDR